MNELKPIKRDEACILVGLPLVWTLLWASIGGLYGTGFGLLSGGVISLAVVCRLPVGKFLLFIAPAPGWFYHVLVMLVAIRSLYTGRIPGYQGFDEVLFMAFLVFCLGGTYLLRLLIFAVIVYHFPRDYPGALRGWPRWFIAPMVTLICWQLIEANVPYKVALSYSLPAMQQLADDVLANKNRAFTDRRVGAFDATDITRGGSGVLFTIGTSCSLIDCSDYGFAYFPDGKTYKLSPAEGRSFSNYQQRVAPNWWLWQSGS